MITAIIPGEAIKKPLIKQGWLRVVTFLIALIPIAVILAIPFVFILIKAAQIDLKAQPFQQTMSLIMGQYLWAVMLFEVVVVLLTVWIFRRYVDRMSFSGLGTGISGYVTETVAGLFTGPALLGICALALLASGHAWWTDIIPDLSSLFISFGMMILISFSEELIFRGYVLNNLMASFSNKWIALSISSVLFAIIHINNPGYSTLAFVNIFLAGMLLGLNYTYTRNLWFGFALHFSWNFFQGPLLGYRVSGFSFPSLLQLETKGDDMITGGAFGIEGSIVSTVVLFIAIVALHFAFERRYKQQ